MRKNQIALWIGSSLLAVALLAGCGDPASTKYHNDVPVRWTYLVEHSPSEEASHYQRLAALEKRISALEKRLEALEARPR